MFKAKENRGEDPIGTDKKQPDRSSRSSTPSILGEGASVTGSLKAAGDIQIEGYFEGDMVASSLTIGEKAQVKGEIRAESILIHGSVKGSVWGRNVHLASTARVEGDVIHAVLSVENSALLQGHCQRVEDPLKQDSSVSRASLKKEMPVKTDFQSAPTGKV